MVYPQWCLPAPAGSEGEAVTVPRKRAVERQRIETPGGRVILGTFGPEGSNGWDLWVPAVCGIVKFTRGKSGTLIRLVPDSASK
jgi:hypothetical protein